MRKEHHGFGRLDLLGAVLCLGVVGCLLAPALAATNRSADRTFCLEQMRALLRAVLKYESTRGHLPLVSSQPITRRPGAADPASPAGYSWLTQTSPYFGDLEVQAFYSALSEATQQLQAPLFNPALKIGVSEWEGSPASYMIDGLICPSYSGESRVSGEHDYAGAGVVAPAITTYHVFSGTHFENREGVGRFSPPDLLEQGLTYEGQGAFPFPGENPTNPVNQGVRLRSVSDGTRYTLALAESNESAYAAWADGQATWLVAAWSGNPDAPSPQPRKRRPTEKLLGWSDEQKAANRTSLGVGQDKPYLADDRWSGTHDRRWGPSSNHPGVIGHAYVDGHAVMLDPAIDGNIYLYLVTRNGREAIFREASSAAMDQAGLRSRNVAVPNKRRARQPNRVTESEGIRTSAEAWSPVEWSPLKVGDLELNFPELLELQGFRLRGDDRQVAEYKNPSRVFSSVIYRRDEARFVMRVAENYASVASPRLYKQLRDGLDDRGQKDLSGQPKRVVWRKHAAWDGGAADFEFVLIEAHGDEPPRIEIGVADKSDFETDSGQAAEDRREAPASKTYIELVGTPDSHLLRGETELTHAADDGWSFALFKDAQGTFHCTVDPPPTERGRGIRVQFRAPSNEALRTQTYEGVGRPGIADHDKPWLRLSRGSVGRTGESSWFTVHDATYTHLNGDLERLSIDFVCDEGHGERVYGRLRYRTSVNPPKPDPDKLRIALYGETEVARMERGYERVRHLSAEMALRHNATPFVGKAPMNYEEAVEWVLEPNAIRLPPPEEGREYWFDAKQRRLYTRPIDAEE